MSNTIHADSHTYITLIAHRSNKKFPNNRCVWLKTLKNFTLRIDSQIINFHFEIISVSKAWVMVLNANVVVNIPINFFKRSYIFPSTALVFYIRCLSHRG